MLLMISQIFALVLGLTSFYFAFFMYEDEQGKLQNRVEQLWIAVNDRKRVTGEAAPALFNKVAEMVKRVFDQILGQKLVSFQLIGVSVCFALAALCLSIGALFAWIGTQLRHM